MVRQWPVESFPMNHKDMFFMKEVKDKLFVIRDIEPLGINPGENIEGCFRFYHLKTRNLV